MYTKGGGGSIYKVPPPSYFSSSSSSFQYLFFILFLSLRFKPLHIIHFTHSVSIQQEGLLMPVVVEWLYANGSAWVLLDPDTQVVIESLWIRDQAAWIHSQSFNGPIYVDTTAMSITYGAYYYTIARRSYWWPWVMARAVYACNHYSRKKLDEKTDKKGPFITLKSPYYLLQ